MSEYYLNELSLNGQYLNIDEFIILNREFIECLRWINNKKFSVFKKSDFYRSLITSNDSVYALGGYRSSKGEVNDLLRKFKLLLELINKDPFWDIGCDYTIGECLLKEQDLIGSSLAVAALRDAATLSFVKSDYFDKILEISLDGCCKEVFSISSLYMQSEYLIHKGIVDYDTIFQIRYRETNLDFSKLEKEYGFSEFQKHEIRDCINTFDRFVNMSWEQIYNDTSLHYKAYSPSRKKNWFADDIECNMKSIDKFRCVNPKRCYGYRENDKFYVVRMERDHTISDYG